MAGCLCGRVYQCPSRLPVTAMMVPLMAAFSVYGPRRPLLTSILSPTKHIPQPPLFLSAPVPLTPKACLPFPGTPRYRYSMVLCERSCDIVQSVNKTHRSLLLIPQGTKVRYARFRTWIDIDNQTTTVKRNAKNSHTKTIAQLRGRGKFSSPSTTSITN